MSKHANLKLAVIWRKSAAIPAAAISAALISSLTARARNANNRPPGADIRLLARGFYVKIEVHPDADSTARRAVEVIAADARAAVYLRGRFILAVSGGRTPWLMLRLLAEQKIPWDKVHVIQVDERAAPAGDPDRNLGYILESLLDRAPLPRRNIHAMPVEAPELKRAAQEYQRTLEDVAGTPAVLDLVHLGLGVDGHTASLTPGDAILDVVAADVAISGLYQGRRRMTLTFPIINRSRRVLWLVTGSGKAEALLRLCGRDPSIPASRVAPERAMLLADLLAANKLGSGSLEIRS